MEEMENHWPYYIVGSSTSFAKMNQYYHYGHSLMKWVWLVNISRQSHKNSLPDL